MKTRTNPHGLFTEQELYNMFSVLFMCVFENIAPENGWTLRVAGEKVGEIINGIIQQSLNEAAPRTVSVSH